MPRRVAPLLILLAACGPGEIEDTAVGDVRGAEFVAAAPGVGDAAPPVEPVERVVPVAPATSDVPATPDPPERSETEAEGPDGAESEPEPVEIEPKTEPEQEPDAVAEGPVAEEPVAEEPVVEEPVVEEPAEPEVAEPPKKSHGFEDANKPVPKGSRRVTFEFLSNYYYLPSDVREEFDLENLGEAQVEIPERVRKLRGKTITIEGFMMPTEVDDEQHTKRLVLMRDVPGCCFASVPPINGWIDIAVHADEELDYVPYMIVEATGTFDCGEEIDDGVVLSIYRMTGARVKESTD